MKVLLTGAAGRLGSATFAELVAAGHDVRATDAQTRQGLPGRVRVLDLMNREAAYELVEDVEAVVHIANHPNAHVSNAQRVFNDNVTMNMNVFQAAVEVGVKRIIYASSVQATTGGRMHDNGAGAKSVLPYLPLDGEIPQCPGNHYALSKCVGEQQLQYFVRYRGLGSAVAIRFPMLMPRAWFGDWRTQHSDPKHLHRHTPLDEAFTWVSMEDGARLMAAVVKAELPGYRCYFPAHPTPRVRLSVAELIQRFYSGIPLRKPLEQTRSLVDISRITAETGWTPVDDFTKE